MKEYASVSKTVAEVLLFTFLLFNLEGFVPNLDLLIIFIKNWDERREYSCYIFDVIILGDNWNILKERNRNQNDLGKEEEQRNSKR